MRSALGTPLDFAALRKAEEDYLTKRHDPIWSVEIHNRRTLPIYGVADAFVDSDALLSRDNPFSGNELMATLELGYMLRLANNNRGFAKRMLYVSRSVFYDDRAAEKFDAGAGSLFAGNRRRLVYPTNAAE